MGRFVPAAGGAAYKRGECNAENEDFESGSKKVQGYQIGKDKEKEGLLQPHNDEEVG
jgi:hypothetical protein